ncbi:hypothetical protein [Rhizobium rhizogenes]|uniref:hypothetical protein n=1 Tax=Rhizobium rhizogenes TaxID=359 RepID=UPI001573F6AF|nr:hypothetical protein [Rhizobium rhizogenes]NTF42835.1 hypothetical protein [Rhizobium rhizogenes]
MLRFSSIVSKEGTHLPERYWIAHELCFLAHDIMTQALVSGEKASVFKTTFRFRDDIDREAFEKASDVFVWLEETRRFEERESFLIATVFPAVLSDMLHCFYEALETSRKAKLVVSYMLIRKPLQETLYLLETMLADRSDFTRKLTSDPIKLYSQTAGGLDVHTKRIQTVIDILGDANRFDAEYIAQLRYDKNATDGFDGTCNKAMHLFTNHQAIRTENLNINFIFSGIESKLTQWSYLYGRLPYLLVYTCRVMESLLASIMPTDLSYLQDMERRIAALVVLWWESIEPPYNEPHLEKFFISTRNWLHEHCQEVVNRQPNQRDLEQMAEIGSFW